MTEIAADPRFRPDSETVPQDWAALGRHLAAAAGRRLDRDPPPRQFRGGFGNLNYLVTLDGAPAVLRRPPPGPRPRGANDMVREARILTALHPFFPLAPRCLHATDDESVLGAPFLLMEHRDGIVIGDTLPPDAGAAEAAHLAASLVDVLANLHAVDPAAIGLGDLGRPDGFFHRTVEGWIRRAEAAWTAPPPAVGELARRLRAVDLPGEPAPAALLHNDYKLDNLILDRSTLAPVALIDWDLGTRGPALWDLAVLLSYWTEPDDPPAMHDLRQMPTAAPGFPCRAEIAAAYAARTGADVEALPAYLTLARFRLAVVFRQIFRRWRETGDGGERCRGFDTLADGLLAFAVGRAGSA